MTRLDGGGSRKGRGRPPKLSAAVLPYLSLNVTRTPFLPVEQLRQQACSHVSTTTFLYPNIDLLGLLDLSDIVYLVDKLVLAIAMLPLAPVHSTRRVAHLYPSTDLLGLLQLGESLREVAPT